MNPEDICHRCGKQRIGGHWERHVCGACDNPVAAKRYHARNRAARLREARQRGLVPIRPATDAERAAIVAVSFCAYCGARATGADHVQPLARGGLDIVLNLAPACGPCNSSKGSRLLTEWNPDRVAYGVAHSPIVAAEYERLISERKQEPCA